MSVTLRRARVSDADALSRLAAQTFRDGWAAIITPPIADAYAAEAFSVEQLAGEISDPAGYIILAVEDSETLVGYGKMETTRAAPDFVTSPKPILLQRLYIAAAYRGQGVGDILLANCVQEALHRNYQSLWLETDPRNERAWRFYLKRSFVDVGGTVYLLPGTVNDRIRVLQKNIAPTIRYSRD